MTEGTTITITSEKMQSMGFRRAQVKSISAGRRERAFSMPSVHGLGTFRITIRRIKRHRSYGIKVGCGKPRRCGMISTGAEGLIPLPR